METPSTLKTGLIVVGVVGVVFISSLFAPRREMNGGGCGPRALLAVARTFGTSMTEAQTLALFPRQGDTVSLAQLQRAAPKLGLSGTVRGMTPAQLRDEKPLGVLHIDDVHFVAAVGYSGDFVLIVDPFYRGETKPVRWFLDDLASRWDGAILTLTSRKGRK